MDLRGNTMAQITINGVTLDPVAQGPALAAANLHAVTASNSNYILIQTDQPLDTAQKAELKNLGVVILEYVPEDTYLCNFRGTDIDQIRSLSYVGWANTYMRGFKLAPGLKPAAAAPAAGLSAANFSTESEVSLSTTPRTIDVVLHANVAPQTVKDQLAAAVQLDPDDLNLTRHKIRVTVAESQLSEIAKMDEVRHVEEVLPMKLHNNVARRILNVEPQPVAGVDLEGAGQIVAVCDTGFDKGSTTDVHEAFDGRVEKLYALGRNKSNDPHGHGTHVAGSVLGDGDSTTLGHTVRGTAPAARLVLQSVLDSGGGLDGLPDDLHDLFDPPYGADGARVHTNSWGSTVGDGRYNSNSHEVDEFVWEHRDCVICFSAGNEGVDTNLNGVVDPRSITPPATAKNCITIGASENGRPNQTLTWAAFRFNAEPIKSDRVASNAEGMVAFSSRGPTKDGRIKPDVVAPGSMILSAKSRDANPRPWAHSDDPLYYLTGGTSMATPLVAGCTALIREFLATQHQLTSPSAALVKAMLINGAHDISGQYSPSEAGGIPNHSEGFGRVDMASTLSSDITFRDEATALDAGEEESTTITVGSGASLKITLVWTDPAGSSLQNDLDLIVRASDGQERHGNMAPGSSSFDRKNNVEQVLWDNVPAGSVTITVRAHRIPIDAQSYALVMRIEGGTQQPELGIDGPEVQGQLSPGSQDGYTLNVTTAGRYTVETSGTTDTFLSVFGPNSDTTLVAEDDDGGPGRASSLELDLQPGGYLVQVRHFSSTGRGAYGVSVSSTGGGGGSQRPSLTVNGAELQGQISPGSQDLYTLNITTAGRYTIDTSGTTDTFLSVFGPNSETTLVGSDDDGGPDRLSLLILDLQVGSYVVQVRHFSPNGTGAYGVAVQSNDVPRQIDVDGSELQGTIGVGGESDLFTFTVASGGEHVIETSGSIDTFLTLLGPNDDSTILEQDDDDGSGRLSRIQRNLGAGTYFVRIRHFSPSRTGDYGVRVRTT